MTLSDGPVALLRQRLGLGPQGQVQRITTQNAAGETSVTEVTPGGLSAVRIYPSGVRQWEWVAGQALHIGQTEREVRWRLLFDDAGRLIRQEDRGQVTAEFYYDGSRLASLSRYEQISDREMGWVEATVIPHPPKEGGVRREEVTEHYPNGLISVELREFDAQNREIFNTHLTNQDDTVTLSRTSYQDDAWGNWAEMTLQTQSNRPHSEQIHVHRRGLEYYQLP